MQFKTILLVDDDEDDQEIFLSAVNEMSIEIKCSVQSNASEALDKLEAKLLVPDVIFLDLNMPIMNGQQFLIKIKKNKQLQDIPVIIFSTSSHVTTIQLMKKLGAHDFITKPDRYDTLLNILRPLFS